MRQLTIATHGADSVQMYVRQARELALRSPEMWARALHNLSTIAENDVIFAAMDGDECHAGRVLIQRLRAEIIEAATDAAKYAAEEYAENEACDEAFARERVERRACEAERAHRAMTEGTP